MVSATEQDLDAATVRTLSSLDVLVRALHVRDAALQPTLDAIVSGAAGPQAPDRDAGLILLVRGQLVPQAAAGHAPLPLDIRQQQTGEGPCIEAARQQTVIRVDTRAESRWPGFAAEARDLGIACMVCVPLWVHEQSLGTLSLYARQPDAFTAADEQVTRLFATIAAVALAGSQRTSQLREALASRDLIGQAKGILVERHRITAGAAFQRLAQASQDRNVKLAEIARYLVETGELPGAPGRRPAPKAVVVTEQPAAPGKRRGGPGPGRGNVR